MRDDLRQYSVSNSIMMNLQFPVPSSEPKVDQQNRNWQVRTEIELTEQKLNQQNRNQEVQLEQKLISQNQNWTNRTEINITVNFCSKWDWGRDDSADRVKPGENHFKIF